jgi:VWFA-related protein
MLSRRKLLLASAVGLGNRAATAFQDDSKGATFKTEVKVVNLLAAVRTKKGEFIDKLNKEDFSVLENGRPQEIRYFSRETDLPLTIGLMVDTSMSQARVMEAERTASFHFLDQVLRENKDQLFILQFDMVPMMRQPLTNSRRNLEEALAKVDTPSRKELQSAPASSAGTVLYDAIVLASRDVMKNQLNRKALILMTDGVDEGSEATAAQAIDAAVRADTLVYSILFSDAGFYGILPFGMSTDGRSVLQRISRETGGSFYEVSKKQGIEQIFQAIERELRSQYSLGFVSDTPVRISEFRKLQLTTKEKGLIVQMRDKYWAQR